LIQRLDVFEIFQFLIESNNASQRRKVLYILFALNVCVTAFVPSIFLPVRLNKQPSALNALITESEAQKVLAKANLCLEEEVMRSEERSDELVAIILTIAACRSLDFCTRRAEIILAIILTLFAICFTHRSVRYTPSTTCSLRCARSSRCSRQGLSR